MGREVMQLDASAVERVIASCREDTSETFLCKHDPPPSICHHHSAAVCDFIQQEYDALRFKVVIRPEDQHVFERLLRGAFETKESATLYGFAGLAPGKGTITRQWAWISTDEASEMNVTGLSLCSSPSTIHVASKTSHVNALLLGIECSAPMKEDFFGSTHLPNAKSKSFSAFGKRKWRDFRKGGQEVPADLGGIRMNMCQETFQSVQTLCEALKLCKPSDGYNPCHSNEKEFFRSVLMASDCELEEFLSRYAVSRRVSSSRGSDC